MHKLLIAIVSIAASLNLLAINYTQNETISGSEPWEIAAGETLELYVNAGATVTVTRVISGEGTLVKKGLGAIALSANNTYSGNTEIHAGEVILNSATALGTSTVRFKTEDSCSLVFNTPNGVFWNNIIFEKPANWLSSYRLPIIFDENTTLKGNITGPNYSCVWIGIQFNGDGYPERHQVVTIDGNIDFSNSELRIRTYGTFIFNGWVKAKTLYMSNSWSGNGIIYLNNPDNLLGNGSTESNCYCPYIHCGARNVINNFTWMTAYRYNATNANSMDLHGFDQVMRSIRCNPVNNPDYKIEQAPNDNQNLRFTSSTSATLTLTGLGAGKTSYIHHMMDGALSLTIDADPTCTIVLSNRTHRMTGDVCVKSGTLKAVNAASFINAKKVTVKPNAMFELNTSRADALAACRNLEIEGKFVFTSSASQSMMHPVVTIGENAEVTFPEGSEIIVKSLIVNGVELPDNTYSASDIPQLKGGTLKVTKQIWPQLVEPVYTISVDKNVTNRLDDISIQVTRDGVTTTAAFAEIANPTAGTILKVGEGVVMSSKKLANFVGQILIEEGGFAIDDNLQTGPQNKDTAPVIWVKSGSSFILWKTANTCGRSNLKLNNSFHLAGEGLNGLGAIDYELDAYQNYTFSQSRPWYLDADTRISGFEDDRFDVGTKTLHMQGHKLELKRYQGYNRASLFLDSVTFGSASDILVDGYNLAPQSNIYWDNSIATTVTFTNSAAFSFWNTLMRTSDTTTLKFASNSTVDWPIGGSAAENGWVVPGYVNQAWWDGPVQVDGTVNIYGTVLKKGVALRGKVSGEGDIRVSSGWLHLYNANNDFSGRVCLRAPISVSYSSFESGLALYANGALPTECSSVTITNGTFALLTASRFDLPAIDYYIASGSNVNFYADSSVAEGTIANLRKTGAGTLSYNVPLTLSRAEVAAGVLAVGDELKVTNLAMGEGTINGDVKVAEKVSFAADAIKNGAFANLTIQGKLTLMEGAKMNLDTLVESAVRVRRSSQHQAVITAEDGIVGSLSVDPESAAGLEGWHAAVDGNQLKIWRERGAVIIMR